MHIGFSNLKSLAYEVILPLWREYSKNWSISVDDIIIMSKDSAPILEGPADVISQQFFRVNPKGGAPLFKTGTYELYVTVSDAVFKAFDKWDDERFLKEAQDANDRADAIRAEQVRAIFTAVFFYF